MPPPTHSPSLPDTIGTVVLGPQAGGRGYRVLERSDGPPLAAEAEARLSELALVLAGWADTREEEAALLVPLADATTPALLARFAFLGAASLGTIAFAHGLLLDEAAFAACAGRPETLLPLIPPPDGARGFGAARLALPATLPAAALRHDWTGLGLEWRDRVVLAAAADEVEPVLRSVLGAIAPAGPGARVRGWATSALIPSAGGFSPPRAFQLLVLGPDAGRPPDLHPGLHYAPAAVTTAGFDGERVELPPAARAWERLKALAADPDLAAAIGPLRWSPAWFDETPAAVLAPATDAALRRLAGGAAQMRLVFGLARPRGDDLDAPFGQVARGLFAQLVGRPALEPQHAAFYVKALADGPADAAAAMAPLGALLAQPGSGRWLRGRTVARLVELGLVDALAERSAEAPALLAGLGSGEAATLLDHVMLSRDGRLRAPTLVSALLRQLAESHNGGEAEGAPGPPAAEWGSVYAAALQWRFGEPPGPDERRLGCRGVVRATHRLARPQMARLAARCLRLRDGGEVGPRERVDMLGGALEWVRLEGAAA